MRGAAALLLGLQLAACASAPDRVGEARAEDLGAVDAQAARLASELPGRYVVVQRGQVVAAATLPDDAVRAAERKLPAGPHRFVFRPGEEGPRLYRLAFLPEGGVVAGRKLFTDLGIEITWRAGRPLVLDRLGRRREIDLSARPTLRVEITTLDRERSRAVEAVLDPDFDGGLLVPPELGRELGLAGFEIPGAAEVEVALGRPFTARRAHVLAHLPLLGARGTTEVAHETPPPAGR